MMSSWVFKEDFERWVIFFPFLIWPDVLQVEWTKEAAPKALGLLCGNGKRPLLVPGSQGRRGAGLCLTVRIVPLLCVCQA